VRSVHGLDFSSERFDLIINWANAVEDYREARNHGSRIESFAAQSGLRLSDTATELHADHVDTASPVFRALVNKRCIGYVMQAATWNRTWPLWKVPELCEAFADALPDFHIVLIDPQAEAGFEAPNVINACGRTQSFTEAAALAARCELVISQDTGIVHGVAAISPDTPQLVLIGSMVPEWRFSHYQAVQWIQHTEMECCPCNDWSRQNATGKYHSCNYDKRAWCLELITPTEIVNRSKGLLK